MTRAEVVLPIRLRLLLHDVLDGSGLQQSFRFLLSVRVVCLDHHLESCDRRLVRLVNPSNVQSVADAKKID